MNFPPSIEATTPVWAVFKLIVERAVVTEDAESDISTPLILISLAEISATDITGVLLVSAMPTTARNVPLTFFMSIPSVSLFTVSSTNLPFLIDAFTPVVEVFALMLFIA